MNTAAHAFNSIHCRTGLLVLTGVLIYAIMCLHHFPCDNPLQKFMRTASWMNNLKILCCLAPRHVLPGLSAECKQIKCAQKGKTSEPRTGTGYEVGSFGLTIGQNGGKTSQQCKSFAHYFLGLNNVVPSKTY